MLINDYIDGDREGLLHTAVTLLVTFISLCICWLFCNICYCYLYLYISRSRNPALNPVWDLPTLSTTSNTTLVPNLVNVPSVTLAQLRGTLYLTILSLPLTLTDLKGFLDLFRLAFWHSDNFGSCRFVFVFKYYLQDEWIAGVLCV